MSKTRRQTVILELIDGEQITSQEMLQQRLRGRGIDATQATISRDLKDLGLVKRAGDGAYGRSGSDTPNLESTLAHLERVASRSLSRVVRVEQLVVLRTPPGEAQHLASRSTRPRYRTSSAPSPATTRCSSSPPAPARRRPSSPAWRR